jgi:hypothetical protein
MKGPRPLVFEAVIDDDAVDLEHPVRTYLHQAKRKLPDHHVAERWWSGLLGCLERESGYLGVETFTPGGA